MRRAAEWHLLTGEYPPAAGGVGDYTAQLARALAAEGEDVNVWCPAPPSTPPDVVPGPRRRDAAFDLRGIAALSRSLAGRAPRRRLVVQYVPNAFGLRGVNVPFCLWLVWRRWVRGDDLDVMFHEPYLSVGASRSLRWNVAAAAQRVMATLLLVAARRVWLSIPAWSRYLRPYGPFAPRMRWLPIPSTIAPARDDTAVAALRRELGGGPVIGHFGTFAPAITELLAPVLLELTRRAPRVVVSLVGSGSAAFATKLAATQPSLVGRVRSLDGAGARDVSLHLQACDLLIQPYPDGVSTRRTTAMAALCHGRALVTTDGPFTESVWREDGLASLSPLGDPSALVAAAERLLADDAARERLAARGREAYDRRFAIERTVALLREAR